MVNKTKKHNTPITTVIKSYMNKKSGKVSSSRDEIKWRFNALDWRYQKQILYAFLQSGCSDREWAYKKLYVVWDDCFIPVLQDLWELYHEKTLSWLVISFFPIDYLKQEIDNLCEGRNYFFLCQRMADDKDFVIDKTKLNELDLLIVERERGVSISDGDVKDLFFLLIYKLCKGIYSFDERNGFGLTDNGDTVLSIFTCPMIRRIIDEIELEQKRKELTYSLYKWMKQVSNDFMKKYKDYNWDTFRPSSSCKETNNLRKVICEHCYNHLDTEYKSIWDTISINDQQRFLDDLEARHQHRFLTKDDKNEQI